MSNVTAPTVVATETLAVPVSRFMSSQLTAFQRSHSALYMALILDVIHSHAAQTPAGYAKSLAEAAPAFADMMPKYCTVIKPALASIHAEYLATLPATAAGVGEGVKWLENQSKLGGYTLSLEDTKRFFKGEWSTKAQAEQKRKDAETRQAEVISKAVAATTAKQVATDISNEHRKDEQSALESVLSQGPSNVRPLRDIEPGVPLNDGWSVNMVTIHTKGDATKVTGLDLLSLAEITALSEQVTTLLAASLQADAARTGTAG